MGELLYVLPQNFVADAKEKKQNTTRFEMDFVLDFAMCSSDFTCF